MNKSAKNKGGKKAASEGQLWLRLPGLVGEALYDETVIGAGLACVDEALEAERAALCGARYLHKADRQALRAGHVRFAERVCRQHQPYRRCCLGVGHARDRAYASRGSEQPLRRHVEYVTYPVPRETAFRY